MHMIMVLKDHWDAGNNFYFLKMPDINKAVQHPGGAQDNDYTSDNITGLNWSQKSIKFFHN